MCIWQYWACYLRFHPFINEYVQIKYDDGEEENLILSNENIKYHVSRDDMKRLKLSYAKVRDNNVSDYDVEEMLAMAASLDDCQDFEPGDIVWAKLTGLCSILFSCSICKLLYVDIFIWIDLS